MYDKVNETSEGAYVFGYALNGNGGVSPLKLGEKTESPCWCHLDFSMEGCEEALQKLNVPEHAIESLIRSDTRPRSIALETGTLLIIRVINTNPGEDPDDMVSLRLWVEKNRLISVRQRRVLSVQDTRKSLETGKGPRGIIELVENLLDRVADRIADYVDTIEEQMLEFESSNNDTNMINKRVGVSSLRRHAAVVRRYLAPQRDALEAFYRHSKNLGDGTEIYYIHEQSDRIARYVEDLDLVRERAVVLQEELMNTIAQQQNERMYVLSIVAVIFLPISFVTGLFGMNVAGLPGMEEPVSFTLVSVGMLLIAVGIMLYFRLKKWL